MSQFNTARETLTRLAEEGFNVLRDNIQEDQATLRDYVEMVKVQIDGWLEEHPAQTTRRVEVRVYANTQVEDNISTEDVRLAVNEAFTDLAQRHGATVEDLRVIVT